MKVFPLEKDIAGLGDFTDLTNQDINLLVESNEVQVSGLDASVWGAVIRGDGDPEFQINSGDWIKSSLIVNGDLIKLRLTAAPTGEVAREARIRIDGVSRTWNVTTDSYLFVPLGSDGLVTSDGKILTLE